MKTIEIKSTVKGMYSEIISYLLWFVALVAAIIFMNVEWTEYRLCNDVSDNVLVVFVPLFTGMFVIFALAILWGMFTTALYDSTKIITLHLNDKDEITKIVETRKEFINKQYRTEAVCDRILSIEVFIPTIGSITNTGRLKITSVIFTNADYKKETFTIEGVENPEKMKDEIMQTSPGHRGLSVSLQA